MKSTFASRVIIRREVFVVTGAIDELLSGNSVPVVTVIVTVFAHGSFDGGAGSEGPATSARTLILHFGDSFAEIGKVSGVEKK